MLKVPRCPNSWRVLAFIAGEKKIKECGMELNSLEVSTVLQERSLLESHAPAPRARWAELQEVMSEGFSSPELVGNFPQEAFGAPGVGLISAKLSCPHL